MQTLQLKDHLTLLALKEKLANSKDLKIIKQWQILNTVANNPELNADFIAALFGLAATIVERYVQLYNRFGSDSWSIFNGEADMRHVLYYLLSNRGNFRKREL